MIVIQSKDEDPGKCIECGAVGGVWIKDKFDYEIQVCPDCFIKLDQEDQEEIEG